LEEENNEIKKLRTIPSYENFINDSYMRCLDLYLAPRVSKKRKAINDKKADDLLPELPDPEELRPFPEIQSLIYEGHQHLVRSISIDPSGKFLASGSGKNNN
jgi:ribosome biogenesis protein ERB1